jgi:hypothetical protein
MNDKTANDKQARNLLVACRSVFATPGRGTRFPHPLTS